MARCGLVGLLALGVLAGCADRYPAPATAGQDLRLTILHTTDIHSRLLPYDFQVLAGDEALGLLQENGPFGGIARMATVIERERGRSGRSIYVDSGDCFQGAPIFNAFLGEAEQRALSQLRPDAVVIGNHEFDEGLTNYVKQLQRWATYPLVAANYLFEPGEPLGEIAHPVEIINADGMRIGIIGVGNFSSLSSITDVGNSLHIVPLEIQQTVQDWIDILRPHVDLIVAVSHAGLGEDEDMIRATEGLDVVMGGHLHIVLMPPKVIPDRTGRPVILAHSGAFAKFVGRLDLVVRDGEVVAHDYKVIPIDSHVPEDPGMLDLIEPYARKLHQLIDLESVYGYAARIIRRFGFDGGDSPLGNLVAEAIRQYARADFGMTNSLGIRTDINPGAITLDQLYNIFPFNNYVTTMYLSGDDVQELLDFSTRRSAGRGCATQIQVSGIEFVMDCGADPPVARDIFFTNCGDPEITDPEGCVRRPLDRNAVYEMATNDYIASGGSGFTVLKVNNTQIDTDVALRDAVLETVLRSDLCVEECRAPGGELLLEGCVGFESCVADLQAFYARDCVRVAQTTPGEVEPLAHCPLDPGGECKQSSTCREPVPCTAATCAACDLANPCPDGQLCTDGFCLRQEIVCEAARCERTCAADADCPGAALPLAPGQRLCVGGLCQPREGAPCDDDGGCIDADAVCPGDACNPCESAAECGDGERCVGGRCAVPVAACVDHRCRLPCLDRADCHPGERCGDDGRCRPESCTPTVDRGAACELDARWRALERCLAIPCPHAEADGRIGRILPPNLEDLPADDNPDDDL
ncbi:MAG: bifunctional metallophosphatase/5'-nucleotidase [Deltaproteobacteria bacterium]|nr:bifunctional metallophosphatase/5'-nucleotidase [Deltaproteobacteria bacterium]